MVQAGDRATLNSPAEQPGDRPGWRHDIGADEWTDRGVVAQLGEHLHGMQGVGGSSPPSSTTSSEAAKLRWYREAPLRPDDGGAFDLERHSETEPMITGAIGERRTTRDGRAWTLRLARPTDGNALARLFADVRAEGRWLVTPPNGVSDPSEGF